MSNAPAPCPCCNQSAILTKRFCPTCLGIIRQIPQARILAMWEDRDAQAIPRYTPAEHTIVRKLWLRIPSGSSCWMSAFYLFLNHAQQTTNKESNHD